MINNKILLIDAQTTYEYQMASQYVNLRISGLGRILFNIKFRVSQKSLNPYV